MNAKKKKKKKRKKEKRIKFNKQKKRRLIYGQFAILIRQVKFFTKWPKIAFSNIRCANVVNL